MQIKKEREVNFELLRITSIILVIILHFLTNSELKSFINFNSINGCLYLFLKSLCFTADNLFVMISGYFLVNSKFKFNKVVDLWLQVFFYSSVIYAILSVTDLFEFSIKDAYYALIPVFSKQYWFFSCYILLYLISPLINTCIHSIDRMVYKSILVVGFLLFVVLDSILINKDPFFLGNGKSILWFVYLYMFAAYIRMYGMFEKTKKIFLFFIALALSMVTVVSYFVLGFLRDFLDISQIEADKLISLVSITVFPASVCLFLFFKKINIKNSFVCKASVFLSPFTFGVYLIHDNHSLRVILWKLIHPETYADSFYLWIYMIVSVPLIYICCVLVDYFRKKLFSVLKVEKIGQFLDMKIERLVSKNNIVNIDDVENI